jgi:type II secretory pathway component PulC
LLDVKTDLKILCGFGLLLAVLTAFSLVRAMKAPSFPALPLQKAEQALSPARIKAAPPLFRERFSAILAPDDSRTPRKAEPKLSDAIADRFRLVTVSLAVDSRLSMAFIENISAGTQKCFRSGDMLEEGVTVAEILDKGAVIATHDGTFLLGFGIAEKIGNRLSAHFQSDGGGDQSALLHKFGGRRTGTNEWHFSRSRVMDYYEELKARPERLVAVFDTMSPIYDETDHIEGYKVDIQGEAEFFKAIGFSQGDIIREVNGIPMTNRHAAENLIRRYADDDLDFIVIKMLRDGKPVQQVYHSHK